MSESRSVVGEGAVAASAPLSVAIVGCGIIGVNHARAIAAHPELTITALIDSVPEMSSSLADLIAAELGAPRPGCFDSLAAAFADAHIDLAVICAPSGLHVQLAEEALALGAHVVIEKPLDVTMPRARRIAALAEAAESRGQIVSVISQHRFDPASVAVASAAHSGEFGRLTSGVASVGWWRSQNYYDSGKWRGTWQLDGGGALMNQGVHTVDLLVWFLGRPVDVFAHTALLAHEQIEVEDIAVATIRFESGALAVMHATTAAYPGPSVRIQVHGSRGSAIIDNDELEYFAVADDGLDPEHSGAGVPNQAAQRVRAGAGGDGDGRDGDGDGRENGAGEPRLEPFAAGEPRLEPFAAGEPRLEPFATGEPRLEPFATGHYRQYVDIVEAIRHGRQPGVRVVDALLSLAVVRAVYVSATLGRGIPIAGVLAGDFDDVSVSTEGIG